MGKIILVTGGARSGKSSFAENLAILCGQPVTYVATAQAFDDEMLERIRLHKLQRPSEWTTIEEPLHVAKKLTEVLKSHQVVLLDCLTLWLSNMFLAELDSPGEPNLLCEQAILSQLEKLLVAAVNGNADLIIVSNELGWSLVPDNKLGRVFRDLSGKANQIAAKFADSVYLVVAGCPLQIKSPVVFANLETGKSD